MQTNEYEHLSTYATRSKGYVRRTQASKSRKSEEHKNISPMHEFYFSLNRKCGNTYFTLIEEQPSIEMQLSLTLLLSNLLRRGLSFERKLSSLGECCVSFLTPSPHIYRQGTSAYLPLSFAPPCATWQTTRAPMYYSVQGKETEAVEVKTGQEPDLGA
jgi:hypothetical protein